MKNSLINYILTFVLGATTGLVMSVKKEEPIKTKVTKNDAITIEGNVKEGDLVEVLIGNQEGIVIFKYRYCNRYDVRLFDGERYYIETFSGYELRKK